MDAEEIVRLYNSGQWNGDAADACAAIRKAPGRRGRARHQARRYGWWIEDEEKDKEAPKHPSWLMPMVTYSNNDEKKGADD